MPDGGCVKFGLCVCLIQIYALFSLSVNALKYNQYVSASSVHEMLHTVN